MDWKLEVVIAPVADVERARAFYVDTLGFRLDSDFAPERALPRDPGDAARARPARSSSAPASAAASRRARSRARQLVVDDIEEAHAFLEERGVANTGPQHFLDGQMTPGVDPNRAAYGTFVFFDDPDGNSWALQEVTHPAR